MAKSTVIAARLHPEKEREYMALQIYDQLLSNGKTPRAILTNALLSLANVDMDRMLPEEPRMDVMKSQLNEIQGDIRALLQAIKSADPTAFRAFANESADEPEEIQVDADFIANAKKAMRQSFRQMSGEG
jgi:hypothetical protein